VSELVSDAKQRRTRGCDATDNLGSLMKRTLLLWILILLLAFLACGERIKLPTDIARTSPGIPDTTYVPISPAWTEAGGIPYSGPEDIHIGFDGYLYITDTGNDRIVKLDQGGNFMAQYEGVKQPNSVSQDLLLRLVATGGNTIYMKSRDQQVFDSLYTGKDIYVVSPDTLIDTVIVSPDSMVIDTTYYIDSLQTAYKGIATDLRPQSGYSTYLVCDYTRDEITRFLLYQPGELINLGAAVPPGYELSKTRGPLGIFTYMRGTRLRLLFCQSLYYYCVQLLDGETLEPVIPRSDSSNIYWQGTMDKAEDVATDEFENIFVVDRDKNQVHKFSRNGVKILSFGGDLKDPMGLAYANKILYVADTGNDRIIRFVLSTDLPH
jgi:sugar lactone lactonase YvrE